MPVTIDITKDLRYRQGADERNVEIAERLFMNGFDTSFIQNITGLSVSKLEEIAQRVTASKQ